MDTRPTRNIAPQSAIPLYAPSVGEAEASNLAECIRQNLLIHGPFVAAFERGIADFVGTAHAVGTHSGTSALHLALLLAGVEAGDEVLITPLTFIAPANAIRYVGAYPVFIDVEPDTWQMDAELAVEFLSNQCSPRDGRLYSKVTGRRIGAIVAVHFLGMPVDLDPLMAIAASYNIPIVEDAAQALGTKYRGDRVGSLGVIGCFSFHGNKLITAGGGGMIVTNDAKIAARARYLANQAKDDPVETSHKEIGYNYRMTNLHGAVGLAQLAKIDQHIAAKRSIASAYALELSEIPGLTLVQEKPDTFYTYWLSSIMVDAAKFGMTARELLVFLRRDGIESLPLYEPLHLSLAHKGAQAVGGAVAEQVRERALSLPSSVGLTENDQRRVIEAIQAAFRSHQ
jgi:perosamine synthetase